MSDVLAGKANCARVGPQQAQEQFAKTFQVALHEWREQEINTAIEQEIKRLGE